jgi:8-oxo-dGTP pyrophosphatase MutT (NUDIX family)
MRLTNQIRKILVPSLCDKKETYRRFLRRIDEGNLVRSENEKSHFCVYFLPYNPITRKIFIVHHKKAGLWLTTGGHIEKGESVVETLIREIKEELGLELVPEQIGNPFLLTITEINNPPQVCRAHFDIWYLIPTDGENFNLDLEEFYESKWVSLRQARKVVTEPNHLKAFVLLEKTRFLRRR